MNKRTFLKGITLTELIIAMTISLIAMAMVGKGVKFFQNILSRQMRNTRLGEVFIASQEISQAVRQAHRIVSVGPDHLELETYNFASYGLLDQALYDNFKRVRYQFVESGNQGTLLREIYPSTGTVSELESSRAILRNVGLLTPTETQPIFFASYLVGTSTAGIQLEIALRSPLSHERWVPIKEEMYVQAE